MKLGQSVALKFLPRDVERDPARLERFLEEVRLALRVTHPNVCRVYDIGDVDGQQFISMEYVDGEDLSSLLRRIGRLPEERGIEIARQICSGLAAAHEQGILHRDLKPANVMIDGRGHARITDFGLAALSGTIEGAEARSGTPAYMAPEQLAGGEVTARSDVYALGLVLYEVFTGKPAFEVKPAAEMAQRQRSAPPTTPSSHISTLDPAIEAVLMRMLDTDPARRPASAVAVAAALPGGDPLAAALAAGETPSPEMVAESGDTGVLAPHWVGLLLLAAVLGVLAAGILRTSNDALGSIETPLSVTALKERARLMAERLGFDEQAKGRAHGIDFNRDYYDWMVDRELGASQMHERVAADRPAIYRLWYRQAPTALTPEPDSRFVKIDDPPLMLPGMLLLHVDPRARLVELTAVPEEPPLVDEGAEPQQQQPIEQLWDALFAEAELDRADFEPVEPERTPPTYADARAAWEGIVPGAGDEPIRIEAAAFEGSPVLFRIEGPWTPRSRSSTDDDGRFGELAFLAIILAMMVGLGLLARRNLRQGRSDMRGAIRVGLFIFFVELFAYLISGAIFLPGNVIQRTFTVLAFFTLVSALTFLAYVSLEPFVRRNWPTTIISWTRLIGGRFLDPLVGRDLLIGAVTGIGLRVLWVAHTRIPPLLGMAEEPLAVVGTRAGYGLFTQISHAISNLGPWIGEPMLTLLTLVILRIVLRRTWAAAGLFVLVAATLGHIGSPHFPLDVGVHLIASTITVLVFLRVGLLAGVSLWYADMLARRVFTFDPGSWMWPQTAVFLIPMVLLLVWGSVAATSGRQWFAEDG
ncbi:MAG: protein kinase domain-containing protein [Planctomycetota bacterium]